jgi:hypothetical protein
VSKICIKCGYNNSDDSNYCEKCGAVLPKINKGVMRPARAKITKNHEIIEIIKTKVEQLLANEIDYDEYYRTLDRLYEKTEEAGIAVENTEISEELYPYFKEQKEIGLTGIDLFLQAINELRTLPKLLDVLHGPNSSPEVIENITQEIEKVKNLGLEMALAAIKHLNLALEMNIEIMKKLKFNNKKNKRIKQKSKG